MKKICIIFTALIVLFTSCGKDTDAVVINEDDSGISLICESYSDKHTTEITVSESAEVTVTVSIKASGGSLFIEALDSSGSAVYRGADITSSCNATIRLLGPDTYTISVSGSKFTGTCTLNWETMGAIASTQTAIINPEELISVTDMPVLMTEMYEAAVISETAVNSFKLSALMWSGVFVREDGAVSVILYQSGDGIIEFDIVTDSDTLNDYATVSPTEPATASYGNGFEDSMLFTLTQTGVFIEQNGYPDIFLNEVSGKYIKQ